MNEKKKKTFKSEEQLDLLNESQTVWWCHVNMDQKNLQGTFSETSCEIHATKIQDVLGATGGPMRYLVYIYLIFSIALVIKWSMSDQVFALSKGEILCRKNQIYN